jgi:hypothetical protein
MIIKQVTDGFYQLSDVLSDNLLKDLIREFSHSYKWDQLDSTDPDARIRLQNSLHIDSELSQRIKKELEPIVEFTQTIADRTLYQNSPQLWEDAPGYINVVHYDTSPNLSVNIQIYLSNSVENIGTHCFKDEIWYSVPYKLNYGYIMIDPTKLLHGTKYPVVDRRRSLYQSYRATPDQSDVW